jgi:uncharacterized protein YecE (DUF72 family)
MAETFDVIVGTSGWQYRHWRERFYPKELPQKAWFDYYARVFDAVEVNNSFYRQPDAETWEKWHDAAPAGFRYAVKANRFITHIKRFKDSAEPLKRFLDGAERLKSHLGPILYQCPPTFHRTPENVERLNSFLDLLPGRPRHTFEFRHDSWYVDQTYEALRKHNVALCIHDMRGTHCPLVTTADFTYVRFHGGEQGYAGNYGDTALENWAERVRGLGRDGAKTAWLFFNNDGDAHAIANALTIRRMLTGDDSRRGAETEYYERAG